MSFIKDERVCQTEKTTDFTDSTDLIIADYQQIMESVKTVKSVVEKISHVLTHPLVGIG